MKTEQIKSKLSNVLDEHLDGYCLVGFDPLTGDPIILGSARDAKTAIAVNHLVTSVFTTGGIGVDGKEENTAGD